MSDLRYRVRPVGRSSGTTTGYVGGFLMPVRTFSFDKYLVAFDGGYLWSRTPGFATRLTGAQAAGWAARLEGEDGSTERLVVEPWTREDDVVLLSWGQSNCF